MDHRSLWLDLKILVMTFGRVLSAAGVAKANDVSIEEFWGICAPNQLEAVKNHSREGAQLDVLRES